MLDDHRDVRMTHPTHTRRIMRALADRLWASPFTGPILFAPVNPNFPPPLPPPSTAIDVDIDTRLAPLAPTPPEEARGTAIPEAPTRDVGARRLDGRRKPLAPAAVTLNDDGTACVAICLFL
jgi:hypothetical protein